MDTRTQPRRGRNGNERKSSSSSSSSGVIGNRGGGEGSFINKCSTSPSSTNDGGCWNDEKDGYVKLAANCCVLSEWHSHGARLGQRDSDGTVHWGDSATTAFFLPDSTIKQTALCDNGHNYGESFGVFLGGGRYDDSKDCIDRTGDAYGFPSCCYLCNNHQAIFLESGSAIIAKREHCVCLRSSQNSCSGRGELTRLSSACGDKNCAKTDYLNGEGKGIITWKNSVIGFAYEDKKSRETACEENNYSPWPIKSFCERNDKFVSGKSNRNCLNDSLKENEQPRSGKSAVQRKSLTCFSCHEKVCKINLNECEPILLNRQSISEQDNSCVDSVPDLHVESGINNKHFDLIVNRCESSQTTIEQKYKLAIKLGEGLDWKNVNFSKVPLTSHSYDKKTGGPRQVTLHPPPLSPPFPRLPLLLSTTKHWPLQCGHSVYCQSVNLSSVRQAAGSVTSHHPILDRDPVLCPLSPLSKPTCPNTMASNHPSQLASTGNAPHSTAGPLGLSNTNTSPIRDRTVSSDRSSDNHQCRFSTGWPVGAESASPPSSQNGDENVVGVGEALLGSCMGRGDNDEAGGGGRNNGGDDDDGGMGAFVADVEGNERNKRVAYLQDNRRGEERRGGVEIEIHKPIDYEGNKQVYEKSGVGKGSEKQLPIDEEAKVMGRVEREAGEKEGGKVMVPVVRRNISAIDGGTTAEVDTVSSKTGSSPDGEEVCHDRRLPVSDTTRVKAGSNVGNEHEENGPSHNNNKTSSGDGCDEDSIIILTSHCLSSDSDGISAGCGIASKDGSVLVDGDCNTAGKGPSEVELQVRETCDPNNVALIGDSDCVTIPDNHDSCVRNDEENSNRKIRHNGENYHSNKWDANVLHDTNSVNNIEGSDDASTCTECEEQKKSIGKTNWEHGESVQETGSNKEGGPFENSGHPLNVRIQDKHCSGRTSLVYANYPDRENTDQSQCKNVLFGGTPIPKDNIVGHSLPSRSSTPIEAGGVRRPQRPHRPQSIIREDPPNSHRLSHQYLNSQCCLSGTPFAQFNNSNPSGMVFTSTTTTLVHNVDNLDKPFNQVHDFRGMHGGTSDKNCREDSQLLSTPKRHSLLNKSMGTVNSSPNTSILLKNHHHYYNYSTDVLRPVMVSSLNVPPGKGSGIELNSNQSHHDSSNPNHARGYLYDMSKYCPMYDPCNVVQKPLPIKPAFQSQTASPVLFQHNPSHKLGPYYNQNQHIPFCDQCQCFTPSPDQLISQNPNFFPYQKQQQHHFYQLQPEQQQHPHQQRQQQQQQQQQQPSQLPNHRYHFSINNHESWTTETNIVCFKRKFNFTPISILWILFSLLISASCLMCFLTPYWMTHPDHAHSFGLLNLCVADPKYARNRPLCVRYGEQYFKYAHSIHPGQGGSFNNIIITRNNLTFLDRLENIGSASFSDIPSRAWRTACLMFGAGCCLEILGAVFAAITLILWEPWRRRVTRMNGYMQTVAVLFLFLGILVYPAGFDSATYTYFCHSSGESYNSGQCSMGWSYITAIVTFALSIFCPVLAWLTTPPTGPEPPHASGKPCKDCR